MSTRDDTIVELFAGERPRLVGLAYRLLGSIADAEDVVQEAWLRWAHADHGAIERPAAWLTTVVSRLGLDTLRARQRERAEYVGPWLPEPIVGSPAFDADPAGRAELADSLTTSFLVMLEQLSPAERLVFLLADVFGEPFAAVAEITGRTESACRQMAVRARRKMREAPAERSLARASTEALEISMRFAAATIAGDIDAVMELLAPDVVYLSDGGRDTHAARRPVRGPARVARFLVNLSHRIVADMEITWVTINGEPGMVIRRNGTPILAQAVHVVDGKIAFISTVVNPTKLAAVDAVVQLT